MRKYGLLVFAVVLLSVGTAQATHLDGKIFCDANRNGAFDAGDTPIEGIRVVVNCDIGGYIGADMSDANGYYFISLPLANDDCIATIDPTTLPAGASITLPASGSFMFSTTDMGNNFFTQNWLIDDPACQTALCWLTGGGVKFDRVADMFVAEHGPHDSIGGNVHPSCDPDPGLGGQWNHVAHSIKRHAMNTVINNVACGNVPGIEPGSESPVTPYNWIEWSGTGWIKGIKGNQEDYPAPSICFFARAEDRNEPGNEQSQNDGAEIDRYFIVAYPCAGTPDDYLLLLDEDGDPNTVDPVTITGGNLQIHISSCDN